MPTTMSEYSWLSPEKVGIKRFEKEEVKNLSSEISEITDFMEKNFDSSFKAIKYSQDKKPILYKSRVNEIDLKGIFYVLQFHNDKFRYCFYTNIDSSVIDLKEANKVIKSKCKSQNIKMDFKVKNPLLYRELNDFTSENFKEFIHKIKKLGNQLPFIFPRNTPEKEFTGNL